MMWRFLAPLCLLTLTASSRPSMPSVNDMGRTAANLSDWQTMTFFLMGVIALFFTERAVASWQSRVTLDKLATAVERLAGAVEHKSTDINVNLELIKHDLAQVRAGLA